MRTSTAQARAEQASQGRAQKQGAGNPWRPSLAPTCWLQLVVVSGKWSKECKSNISLSSTDVPLVSCCSHSPTGTSRWEETAPSCGTGKLTANWPAEVANGNSTKGSALQCMDGPRVPKTPASRGHPRRADWGGGQAHGEGLLSSLEPLLGVVKMLQEKPKSRIHVGSLTHISNKHRSGFDKQQND